MDEGKGVALGICTHQPILIQLLASFHDSFTHRILEQECSLKMTIGLQGLPEHLSGKSTDSKGINLNEGLRDVPLGSPYITTPLNTKKNKPAGAEASTKAESD